jgi:hypothetical protein
MGKKPVLGSLTGFFMNYCGKEDTLLAFFVLVLEKNRWDLGASSRTRNPDSPPTKLPEEPNARRVC